MSAIIPTKPGIGIHDCRLILTNKLCVNNSGNLTLNYHEYKKGKGYYPLCHKLMNDTDFGEYFHPNKELVIAKFNIRYLNSMSLLNRKALSNIPYHMSAFGPDIWNGPIISITNSIFMNSVFRPGVEYLKNPENNK